MTKQGILDHFKDINEAYNDCTRFDSLSRMIDELLESKVPQLMTLEEIRKADYVWLEVNWPYTKNHEPYLEVALPVPYEDWNHEDMILFRTKADISNADHHCSQYYHGFVWRCWTEKPTLDQMLLTEWTIRGGKA